MTSVSDGLGEWARVNASASMNVSLSALVSMIVSVLCGMCTGLHRTDEVFKFQAQTRNKLEYSYFDFLFVGS